MLTRSTQITESHCGPAVVQMLLSNLGIKASQKRITKAAGVEKRIKKYGIRVDQMAKALKGLKLDVTFWYKKMASIEDIIKLNEMNYPVGIEWQGMFYEKTEEEEPGYDYGHYAIVSRVDRPRKELILIDPYKYFSNRDRIMDIQTFKERWWDENEVLDQKTRRKRVIKDEQLLFVIAKKNDKQPGTVGLKEIKAER